MRTSWIVVSAIALLACEEKKETPQAVSKGEIARAPSATPPPPAPETKALRFSLDPKGTTSIDMPAPKEHIKATASDMAGWVDISPTDLGATKGEIKVDLSTFVTKTFESKEKNESQTEHARQWFEAVVDGKVKEENRWVVFSVKALEDLSATDLTKVSPQASGGASIRAVTATVKGDLFLHGRKVEKKAAVEVQFQYPEGAAPDAKPTGLAIKSKAPFRIVLAEHDVKPRDKVGSIIKESLNLFGTKVAETADVTVDLKAKAP